MRVVSSLTFQIGQVRHEIVALWVIILEDVVFCYKNCSELLGEKVVLRIDITRSIFETEYFFDLILQVSHILYIGTNRIEKTIWGFRNLQEKLEKNNLCRPPRRIVLLNDNMSHKGS